MSQADPDAWRRQVRQWLATVMEPARAQESGVEADLAVFHNLPQDEERLLLERCRAYQRVGRYGTAEDVAAAVAFLLGPRTGGFCVGVNLVVDGGLLTRVQY